MSIKPGDIIEWVYKSDDSAVAVNEEVWSSINKCWCCIGSTSVHLCVAVFDETIVWINDKGLFHARVDESGHPLWCVRHRRVVPRARG